MKTFAEFKKKSNSKSNNSSASIHGQDLSLRSFTICFWSHFFADCNLLVWTAGKHVDLASSGGVIVTFRQTKQRSAKDMFRVQAITNTKENLQYSTIV